MMGKKQAAKKATPARRLDDTDAIELVTTPQLREAFERRRANIETMLADAYVNRLMPDYQEWEVANRRNNEKNIRIFKMALKDIKRRLDGADAVLRAYGKPKDEAAADDEGGD